MSPLGSLLLSNTKLKSLIYRYLGVFSQLGQKKSLSREGLKKKMRKREFGGKESMVMDPSAGDHRYLLET